MKTYLFSPDIIMNTSGYWIDRDFIKSQKISSLYVNGAIESFRGICKDNGIDISDNAVKTKQPIMVDTKDGKSVQVGFIFKASTETYNDLKRKYVKFRLEIWVEISELNTPKF